MPTDPSGEARQSKVALFLAGVKTILFAVLKWLFIITAFLLAVWWVIPDDWPIKYACEYALDTAHVVIERKPHNCDWDSAPLGSKHCHYGAIVSVYNRYGQVIEGPGVEKTDPPGDPNAAKVHVEWGRLDD